MLRGLVNKENTFFGQEEFIENGRILSENRRLEIFTKNWRFAAKMGELEYLLPLS